MAIAYVGIAQEAAGTNDGAASTVATAARTITSGNIIVAFVNWTGDDTPAPTLADQNGQNIPFIGAKLQSDNYCGVFFKANVTGSANTVWTATLGENKTYRRLHVLEFSGATTTAIEPQTGPVNFLTFGSGSTTTPATGNFTLGGNGAVVAGCATYNTAGSFTAGSGQTEASSDDYLHSQYRIVTTAGSYANNGTISSADLIAMVGIALREVPASGIDATQAETITPVDSPSAVAVYPVTRPETIAPVDTETAVAVLPVAVAETISAADSQDAAITSGTAEGVDETITPVDTQTAAQVHAATQAETIAPADTPSAAAVYPVSLAESVAAADTQTAGTVRVGSSAEAVAAADTQNAALARLGATNETIAAADTQNAAASYGAVQAESIAAADTQSAAQVHAGTVAEALAVVDDNQGSIAGQGNVFNVSVAETLNVRDSLSQYTKPSLAQSQKRKQRNDVQFDRGDARYTFDDPAVEEEELTIIVIALLNSVLNHGFTQQVR